MEQMRYLLIDREYLGRYGHKRALRFAYICFSLYDAIIRLEGMEDRDKYIITVISDSEYNKLQERIY